MPINLTDEQRETLRRCLCVALDAAENEARYCGGDLPSLDDVAAWLERGGDGESLMPGSGRFLRHDIYHLADMLGEWPINYHGCEGWRFIWLASAEECLALRDRPDPTVTPTGRAGDK